MRLFKFCVFCLISIGLGNPVCAQTNPGSLSNTLTRAVTKNARSSVAELSRAANRSFLKRLSPIFQKPRTLPRPEQHFIPKRPNPISFLVQSGPQSPETASAFAVEVGGKLIGVTAGHVMNNIKNFDPRMSFPQGKERVEFSISNWRMSNRKGNDVAVFAIPEEARPYIQPLKISSTPAEPWQTVSIAGHANNFPVWLPNEEILFVGPQRILLRNTSKRTLFGMCGSPVLIDGKVTGLYVGYDSADNLAKSQWADPLRVEFDKQLPSLHRVAPIEHIFPLIEKMLFNMDTQNTGTMLQVLGKPIAPFANTDALYTITLLRNDRVVKSIYPGPLADPEHLEQFFEMQENDELLVEVWPEGYPYVRTSPQIYKVNVSTGKVEKLDR